MLPMFVSFLCVTLITVYSVLHDRASSVQPKLKLKPTTIIAAVLKAEHDTRGDLQQEDFLWIKCNAVSAKLF